MIGRTCGQDKVSYELPCSLAWSLAGYQVPPEGPDRAHNDGEDTCLVVEKRVSQNVWNATFKHTETQIGPGEGGIWGY